MHIVRVGHPGSSTETTDGEILVAFLAQTWPQK